MQNAEYRIPNVECGMLQAANMVIWQIQSQGQTEPKRILFGNYFALKCHWNSCQYADKC